MAPNRPKRAKACRTSTTTKTVAEKEWLLKARTLTRAQQAEARRVKAEEHKETGNAHFRKGEYRKATAEYEVAIDILPTAAYFSNMAAAWLKLEAYDAAEECAQNALRLDPRFTRARYRRGLARKGNLQLAAAVVDFMTVLEQDPNSTEARKALDETFTLINERNNEEDESVTEEDCGPSLTDPGKELESVSDSSDWNHVGNGLPCRHYNHDGCMRGVECRFSHAPDHRGVRDRLGRNVCVHFLLGDCRSGSCVFSHDKTYLPSGRWWDDEQKRGAIRLLSKGLIRRQNPSFLHHIFANIDDRIAWAHPTEKEDESTYWSENIEMLKYFGDEVDDDWLEVEYTAQRSRGQAENWGFTDDEVQELICQGVKPWDDDASDVLDALRSL
ncbi:hypothetical protein BJY52DRAFT_1190926 [Lactarius psammicola]|nr:hypothetical protein BJY52DRAFT_1190926 [Lactarius psammicola]